jgi:hypothetical protein
MIGEGDSIEREASKRGGVNEGGLINCFPQKGETYYRVSYMGKRT